MPQKFVIFFSLGSSYHENIGQISAQFETVKNSYKPTSLIFVPVDTGHWRTNVVHKIYEAMKKGSTKASLEDALSNPEKREDVFRSAYKEEYEAGIQWRHAFKESIEVHARIHFGSSVSIEFQNWYDLDPEYDFKLLKPVSKDSASLKAPGINEITTISPVSSQGSMVDTDQDGNSSHDSDSSFDIARGFPVETNVGTRNKILRYINKNKAHAEEGFTDLESSQETG